ncbi:hypothetical protein [Halodesulfovibrio sp.]|uniref:hypothetical protein n=1 Tax=Halodesulfovibrio sp. TaxID=1912772 RepID=UPI0025E1F18C|nr:hypothetical protein [Halodesulfovibrio sp.]MCT4627930.1 hypothetical protein [Halodesulfovibrio sp.]
MDEDRNFVKNFGVDNPHTADELAELGVLPSRGLDKTRKPMTQKQYSEEIRALCTTEDATGAKVYNANKAAVLSRAGNNIHAINQQYENLVAEGIKRHVRAGAKPDQVRALVEQQVATMLLGSSKPKKGGLEQPKPSLAQGEKQSPAGLKQGLQPHTAGSGNGSTAYKGFIGKRKPDVPDQNKADPFEDGEISVFENKMTGERRFYLVSGDVKKELSEEEARAIYAQKSAAWREAHPFFTVTNHDNAVYAGK